MVFPFLLFSRRTKVRGRQAHAGPLPRARPPPPVPAKGRGRGQLEVLLLAGLSGGFAAGLVAGLRGNHGAWARRAATGRAKLRPNDAVVRRELRRIALVEGQGQLVHPELEGGEPGPERGGFGARLVGVGAQVLEVGLEPGNRARMRAGRPTAELVKVGAPAFVIHEPR